MKYFVEFRSHKLDSYRAVEALHDRCKAVLAGVPHQGAIHICNNYESEFGYAPYVMGLSWGGFDSREKCDAYAQKIRERLAPLGIDPDDVHSVGYEGGGCGVVDWSLVEDARRT